MSTELLPNGMRAVRCYECDATGPEHAASGDARAAAKEAGWARNYPNGRGEGFRCPQCRAGAPGTDPDSPLAVSPVVAAKVLTVLHLDEYFVTDDEQDLVEVLVCDVRSTTTARFSDDQLLEFGRACRLTTSDAGLEQLAALAKGAGR